MLSAQTLLSQDPHFSQYYNSEATTNPAFIGMFKGQNKVSGLYRQQWPQYGQPFISGLLTAEFKLRKEDENYFGGNWTAGVTALYDKTPEGVFKNTLLLTHLAYQLPLDENGYHHLSTGVSGGYGQRSINTNNLTYASQFTRDGFDTNIPNGETFAVSQQNYFDVNAGILYSYENETTLVYAGASAFHLSQPSLSFINEKNILNKLPLRYNIQAGFNVANGNLQYAGSALYMQQAGVNYLYAGAAIGFPFGVDDGIIYTGLWWRKNESFVPTVQLQYHSFNLGISYDVPSNKQHFVSPRSMEFSLAYLFSKQKDKRLGCFRF